MITDPVQIDRASLIEAARELSLVVVSVDRIGSTFPDDEHQRDIATGRFTDEWGITRHLAAARRVLLDALDEGLTEDKSLREEEQFDHAHWSAESPKPPQ